jgi:S1-C subfamily serine protease
MVNMQKSSGAVVDRKLIAVLIIVCVVLAGSFALVYLDLKADFESLKNSSANLASEVDQLQGLIQDLHANQTNGLTAVQIYNRTMFSVVLITNQLADGSTAEGTGFVYDSQGHIVTNNHVVDGAASITVTFFDGSVQTAQLTGNDVYSDLALIKVGNLPAQSEPLLSRNSTQLMVGEPVYAIGNPFGLSSSMTSGIVSQLGRVLRLSDLGVPPPEGNYSIADVIQFDAAVNPGNSGGPLLDSFGYVIGVTFAIETGNTGTNGFIGIAYAVPSVLLLRVVPDLESKGHYDHPWVGIEYDPRYTDGVHVVNIVSGGPAEKAGLQAGDVIKEVDGRQMNRGEDFIIYLERYKSPSDTISLNINRNGSIINKTLTLEARQ